MTNRSYINREIYSQITINSVHSLTTFKKRKKKCCVTNESLMTFSHNSTGWAHEKKIRWSCIRLTHFQMFSFIIKYWQKTLDQSPCPCCMCCRLHLIVLACCLGKLSLGSSERGNVSSWRTECKKSWKSQTIKMFETVCKMMADAVQWILLAVNV